MTAQRNRGTSPRRSQAAVAPGGRPLALAKKGVELALWARVGIQRRAERLLGRHRPVPTTVPPTAVLKGEADWRRSVVEARKLRLPLHPDSPKNWDALGAVSAVLTYALPEGRAARVLDAGSARYSTILAWLRLYGLGGAEGDLLGINLEFTRRVVRDAVTFQHGDATDTQLESATFDAVTCMSVIEHGVPVQDFLAEAARILRPGGVLCVSTDYDQDPPDVRGFSAYGSAVKIFGPDDIRQLVRDAHDVGLDLLGDLSDPSFFEHAERPVHWRRTGLDYTFILLTFVRTDD